MCHRAAYVEIRGTRIASRDLRAGERAGRSLVDRVRIERLRSLEQFAAADRLTTWSAAWPDHRLPQDLVDLVHCVDGIYLSADLDAGRSYDGPWQQHLGWRRDRCVLASQWKAACGAYGCGRLHLQHRTQCDLDVVTGSAVSPNKRGVASGTGERG